MKRPRDFLDLLGDGHASREQGAALVEVDFEAVIDLCEKIEHALLYDRAEEAWRSFNALYMTLLLAKRPARRGRPRRSAGDERTAALFARVWHERDGMPIGEAVDRVIDTYLAGRFASTEARRRAALRITRMSSERTTEVRQYLGLIRKLSKN